MMKDLQDESYEERLKRAGRNLISLYLIIVFWYLVLRVYLYKHIPTVVTDQLYHIRLSSLCLLRVSGASQSWILSQRNLYFQEK